MSGGGKTSKQETEQKIDPDLKKAALENLDTAKLVASLPYAPNMGIQVADFSPTQKAAFSNTNAAASAFGLSPSSGTGLPTAQTSGGLNGFSTSGLYNDAVNSSMSPEVQAAYMGALALPEELKEKAVSSSEGGGKGGSLEDSLVASQQSHIQPSQKQSAGSGK